jgi:hypothetical protein
MAKKSIRLQVIKGERPDVSPLMKSLEVLLAYEKVDLVFFNELMLDSIKQIQVLSAGAATKIEDLFEEPKIEKLRDIYYLSRIVGDCLKIISSGQFDNHDVKNLIFSVKNIVHSLNQMSK